MISQLSAKYQFCSIHTADTTDGKVTTRAALSIESEKVLPYFMIVVVAQLLHVTRDLPFHMRLSSSMWSTHGLLRLFLISI